MNTPTSSRRPRLSRRIFVLLLLCASQLSACATPPPPARAASGDEDDSARQLMPRIKTLIGDAPCDSDAQCRTIAVGFKACGGPGSYMAWSTKNVDEARLKDLVQRHAQAERAESERLGRMSDCRLVTDPGAVCRAGRCQLQQQGIGGGLSVR
ncbi:hypothetical protein G8A07_25970 [Roseateles sp. DAIF2]|uniref:hypothetical protein n=1 Tax=Roseateles sp. DAIF2 TaxID=2714952 RepID=UPI0018A284EB|nr:hypothetical protein [Roseateles sp. DAIF2]QPF76030.1 hypothetical protein G8A07_25970 [Roseateles sp. DAIF2]